MIKIDSRDLAAHLREQQGSLLFCLLDEVRDFIFVKDTESRFLYSNRAHLEHLGRTETEVFRRNDFDLYPEELASGFFAEETRLFDTRTPVVKIQESLNAKGERFYTWAVKVGVVNLQDQLLGLAGVVRRVSSHDNADLAETREHILNLVRRDAGLGVTPSQLFALEASLDGLLKKH